MKKTFTKSVKEEILRHVDKIPNNEKRVLPLNKVCIVKDLRINFIKHGTVYDPEISHHLEFNFNNLEMANICIKELLVYDICGKLSITNKNRYIVYIVDAMTICNLIKILGANNTYKNYKKVIDYKLKIKETNRKVNFEVANIRKAASAAITQIEDINELLRIKKLYEIDDGLRDLIKARLKYKTLSLSELAEKLGTTKSTLNHRFIKIRKILKDR